MDRPPPKKKRLTKKDEDSESEEDFQDVPSTLSSDKSERKVSFAPAQNPASSQVPISSQNAKPTSSQPQPMEEADTDSRKKEPRLVMKKMVLNNFKSYAGRQVIGPFHKV
jgi:hypothetical protein